MKPIDELVVVTLYQQKRRSIAFIRATLPHLSKAEISERVRGLKRIPTSPGRSAAERRRPQHQEAA